jgi:hypothetical protein
MFLTQPDDPWVTQPSIYQHTSQPAAPTTRQQEAADLPGLEPCGPQWKSWCLASTKQVLCWEVEGAIKFHLIVPAAAKRK